MVGYPQIEDVVANALVIHFVDGELHSFQEKFSDDRISIQDPAALNEQLPNGMPNVADAYM